MGGFDPSAPPPRGTPTGGHVPPPGMNTPGATPPGATPPVAPHPRMDTRTTRAAILVAVGAFLGALGASWTTVLVFIPVLAIAVVLLLHRYAPAKVPANPRLHFPEIIRIAVPLFAFACLMGLRLLTIPLWVGTFLLVRDASRRGEIGSWDFAALWHGWKRVLAIAALLAAVTLGFPAWTEKTDLPGTYCGYYSYSYCYSTPGWESLDETAQHTGIAVIPAALLFAALAWAGRTRAWRPPWERSTPLASALAAIVVMVVVFISTMPDEWLASRGYSQAAFGPFAFLVAMIPFTVAAVMMIRASAGSPPQGSSSHPAQDPQSYPQQPPTSSPYAPQRPEAPQPYPPYPPQQAPPSPPPQHPQGAPPAYPPSPPQAQPYPPQQQPPSPPPSG